MHLFYTPDINADYYTLNEDESKHCARVLRLNIDDIIYLIDGKGGFYTAKIEENHAKRCLVRIIETKQEYGKRDYKVHIAIAPTKNMERFEWFLEKATEIGIDEITPLLCSRSERTIVKPERLEKIITSAVKQSISAYHPQLNELIKFKDFLQNHSQEANYQRFIAHCIDSEKQLLKDIATPNSNYLILIGAEGDFTADEVAMALEHKFLPTSLGKSRLRTETAGIVACHTFALIN